MKLPYWIQRADFSATDFEPVDVIGAELILRNHDWRSELRLLKSLEDDNAECCPPGVGFVGAQAILHLCPNDNRSADCHLTQELSAPALARAERTEHAVIVTDPDAVRSIYGAPLLLQYRLLQLVFRPDLDALLYLFDEYLAPP